MSKILGYDANEMIGKDISFVYKDASCLQHRQEIVGQIQNGGSNKILETQWRRKDGSVFDCRIFYAVMVLEDKLMNIAIADDITSQKLTEKRIKASLKEKEMLLKEIHHRVKNNMQVISSLLSLQEDKITAENALLAFKDSQNRIQSIALVHEILYQSDNFSRIHVQTYLDALISYIQPVYSPLNCEVNILNQTENINLKIDHAVPCGLIATELISNALKYACAPEEGLVISVAAQNLCDNQVMMQIKDNGVGDLDHFQVPDPDTLGLRIVTQIICGQLEGTFRLDLSRGVAWTIKWSV